MLDSPIRINFIDDTSSNYNDIVDVRNFVELSSASTSKGNQRKWYDKEKDIYIKEQFNYQGVAWRDDLVEVIASKVGAQLNTSIEIVTYESKRYTDGVKQFYGCEAANFCARGENFVSFYRLMTAYKLNYDQTDDPAYNFSNLCIMIKEMTGLDATEYLTVIAIIDFIVGNEDRHLNNFGVIMSDNGFRLAPVFDSGLGLFEHDERYKNLSFRECIKAMQSKPFHNDNEQIIKYLMPTISKYLPDHIDLTGVEIPSPKAGSYLRNRCMKLGVKLIGVD